MERIEGRFAPARFMDIHADRDHGRSVYTLAARQGDLSDGLVSGAAEIIRTVDLTRHQGLHPFVGALDVMPVVYLSDGAAGPGLRGGPHGRRADRRGAGRAGDPVWRAGLPARAPRAGAALREGGWRRLAERLESGEVRPDFGPAARTPHRGRGARHRAAAAGGVQRGPRVLRRGVGALDRGRAARGRRRSARACARSA